MQGVATEKDQVGREHDTALGSNHVTACTDAAVSFANVVY